MERYDHDSHPNAKLCVSYSELSKITPSSVDKVLYERRHPESRIVTEPMEFGIARHESLAISTLRTGKPYEAFKLDYAATHVEQAFTTELMPGIFLHSRPDVVCAGAEVLIDYKTCTDAKTVATYNSELKKRQLRLYSFQLGLHGIRINKAFFAVEIWSKDYSEILGYETVEFPISFKDIAPVVEWAKDRTALLVSVSEERT